MYVVTTFRTFFLLDSRKFFDVLAGVTFSCHVNSWLKNWAFWETKSTFFMLSTRFNSGVMCDDFLPFSHFAMQELKQWFATGGPRLSGELGFWVTSINELILLSLLKSSTTHWKINNKIHQPKSKPFWRANIEQSKCQNKSKKDDSEKLENGKKPVSVPLPTRSLRQMNDISKKWKSIDLMCTAHCAPNHHHQVDIYFIDEKSDKSNTIHEKKMRERLSV